MLKSYKRKLSILYTESSLNIGGQEIQSLTQMDALKKNGHKVLLACRHESKIGQEAKKHGIDVKYIPFRNSIHPKSIYLMVNLVREFNPNIVICHSGHDSNISGITKKILTNKKYMLIRQKTYVTKKIKTLSINFFCDAVIVPSLSIKQKLEISGCTRKIQVMSPGFDFDDIYHKSTFQPPLVLNSWLSQCNDIPVILQVGMLRPEKGHYFMLKVLYELKIKGIKFHWLIAGSGKQCEKEFLIKEINRLKMGNEVLLAGNVNPVYPLYKIANLCVMPSQYESFGMAIIEASAFAVPVFANDAGGMSEIINHGKTGTLLTVNDINQWVLALIDFFNQPSKYNLMAKSAQAEVLNKFSIENIVSAITAHDNIKELY
ncbi:TPA: glycosyltransferase [Escherichia coli]